MRRQLKPDRRHRWNYANDRARRFAAYRIFECWNCDAQQGFPRGLRSFRSGRAAPWYRIAPPCRKIVNTKGNTQ